MKTALKVLALTCVFLSLTGCASMSGRWNLDSITPETAKKDFQLQCMCLKDDGTFAACASDAGKSRQMSGTYKYDGSAKTLTFTSQGKDHKYSAEIVCLSDKMKVWGGEKGKEWTAYMVRGKCACPGSKGCCDPKCCAAPAQCDPKQCDPKKCDPKSCPVHKTEPKK